MVRVIIAFSQLNLTNALNYEIAGSKQCFAKHGPSVVNLENLE